MIALTRLIKGLNDFIHSPAVSGMPYYNTEKAAIDALLTDPALNPVILHERER